MPKGRLTLQFVVMLAVVLVVTATALYTISDTLIHELGSFAAEAGEQSMTRQAEESLRRLTAERAAHFETHFQWAAFAASSLAMQVRVELEEGGTAQEAVGLNLSRNPVSGVWAASPQVPAAVGYWGVGRPDDETLGRMAALARLSPMLLDAKENVPACVAAWLLTEDGVGVYVPNNDIASRMPPASEMGPRSFHWYTAVAPEANPKRLPCWSDPYADMFSGELVLTISVPVYDAGGAFIGAAGVDLGVGELARDVMDSIRSVSPGGAPHPELAFLAAQDGRLLFYTPGTAEILGMREPLLVAGGREMRGEQLESSRRPDIRELARALRDEPRGMRRAAIDGVRYLILWDTFPASGWRMAHMIPENAIVGLPIATRSAMDAAVDIMVGQFLSVTIVCLLMAGLAMSGFLMLRVFRPLGELAAAMRKVSGGDLSARVAAPGRDEIGEIGGAFNEMAAGLARQRESLARAEAMQRALLNAPTDLIALISIDGTIEAVNTAGAARFGKRPEELVGTCIFDLFPPEVAARRRGHARQIAATGEAMHYTDMRGELVFENSLYPVFDSEGRVTHMAVYSLDVSREHMLAQQLRQSQKLEAVGRLAGGVAHDFNNILAAVLGFTELLLDEVREGTAAHHYATRIAAASTRARDLIRQLLQFSRKVRGERKVIDVCAAVAEAMRLLKVSLPAGVQVREELDPEAGSILADPTGIQQIILNLGTNAGQAMPEGGVLRVSAARHEQAEAAFDLPLGRYVRIEVEDSGRGIEPAVLEHIFEPFFTTKGVGEGTGLGLAVVHGIVKSHGGEVRVDSASDQGARFTIFLPAVEAAAEPEHVQEDAARGSERVLLVEDEPDVLDSAAAALRGLGYTVTATLEPLDAIRRFELDPDEFDVLVTDQRMPGISGTDLARRLHAIRADLPVVIISGNQELLSPDVLSRAGACAVLGKPLSRRELAAELRRALVGDTPALPDWVETEKP